MRILGIDPGTAILGWGVIDYDRYKLTLVAYGAITTKAHTPIEERLEKIFNDLNEIINQYNPGQCVIEELFFNNNAKTVITVGEARGVAILAAKQHAIPIFEYTALEVKNALSGYGRAQKAQIQNLVKLMLSMKEIPQPDDAADALAIAIAHTQYYKKF